MLMRRKGYLTPRNKVWGGAKVGDPTHFSHIAVAETMCVAFHLCAYVRNVPRV
jgi:hypothetical protein